MKNTLPTAPAATAETLAANFQITELEPRLENGWSVTNHEETENPTGGNCKE